MHLTAVSPASMPPATIACDVSSDKLNLFCRALSSPGSIAEWEIPNRTEAITSTLNATHEQATARGIAALRVIVEPTGVYHRLLLRIAVSLGFQTALVDASHDACNCNSNTTEGRPPWPSCLCLRRPMDRRPSIALTLTATWWPL